MELKLNVEKIEKELERLGKSKYWLAKQAKRSPQIVLYWLDTASLRGAEPIAQVFNIDPKDLVV
jgi:hypothetical protein